MRLGSFFSRMLMDPVERSLADPTRYREPVDPEEIRRDIESGRAGLLEPESRSFALGAIQSYQDSGKPMSIQSLGDELQGLRSELGRTSDRSLYEWGVGAICGTHLVQHYLIARADRLAQGIKPGAREALAQAFDPDPR